MYKINNLRSLKIVILIDLRSRRIQPGWRIVLNPVIRFQLALRVYEYLLSAGRPIFAVLFKIYFNRLSLKLGFSIPPHVFGPGLCIVHYGTIVVSPRAKVGRNCRIHVGVNIGGKAGFYDEETAVKLCPTIGSNCYIGPGAKIFGPVVLGKGCQIGANAVVTRSFSEDNCVLVGVPALVQRRTPIREPLCE